jgi:UDP-N-acetylglucosamine diphosphorylase / glucose-1-phosphate thymidylyltransferase / UDP-N-acetylgalactosamine diphosphorylase / glucosamine-1-phosphate N-acetyltransferase / galactosamine-1-phosphate N-acetyltransferase
MSETVTKAVILAAGRGSRMRELTQDKPKPMVQVCGKPILSYIVNGLRGAGIGKILVVVGYRKEVVQAHFQDGSAFGVEMTYAEQVAQDGTGKAVELAKPFCQSEPFILSYGDILVDPSCYIPLTQPGDAELMLTVRHTDDVSKGGAVYLNNAFEVVDLREKQSPDQASTCWYNAGIYTFKATVFAYLARLQKSPRGEYELTDAIRAIAQDGKKVKAVEIRGYWADVRDPEALAEVNEKPPRALAEGEK